GKVGVDNQAGAFADEVFVAVALEAIAVVWRAAILPDDRVVDGNSGLTIPHDRRLSLVGDADGGNVSRAQVRAPERLCCDRDLRRPDLAGIMLNPARTRKHLWKLPLADADDGGILIEDEGARARRALIERENVRHVSSLRRRLKRR